MQAFVRCIPKTILRKVQVFYYKLLTIEYYCDKLYINRIKILRGIVQFMTDGDWQSHKSVSRKADPV